MKRILLLLCAVALLPLSAGNFNDGSNTCPTSGNKQLSTTQTKFVWGVVVAGTANTGKVYVGGSGITSTSGAPLNAGDSLNFPPQGNAAAYDLSKVYFACAQTTDTVTYVYAQ